MSCHSPWSDDTIHAFCTKIGGPPTKSCERFENGTAAEARVVANEIVRDVEELHRDQGDGTHHARETFRGVSMMKNHVGCTFNQAIAHLITSLTRGVSTCVFEEEIRK